MITSQIFIIILKGGVFAQIFQKEYLFMNMTPPLTKNRLNIMSSSL